MREMLKLECVIRATLSVCLCSLLSTWSSAQGLNSKAPAGILQEVGIDQKLGNSIPLDLTFTNADGQPVRLEEYFNEKPIVLSLVYYECPMLCNQVLDGLVRSFRPLSFSVGEEFDVVTVSIDPGEKPALAAEKKATYTKRYGRAEAVSGWHFLTGEREAIEKLAEAVGFRYAYDPDLDQYAHAAGIMLATPSGRLARYFYGIEYATRDLRLGLIEASSNRIGSPIDQVLLFCYHYDPTTGRYGVVIMNVLRLAGAATVLVLGTFIFLMLRKDRRSH